MSPTPIEWLSSSNNDVLMHKELDEAREEIEFLYEYIDGLYAELDEAQVKEKWWICGEGGPL